MARKDAGVKAAYQTVHKLVRYRLKAKLKVPRKSNKKQHPQAEELTVRSFARKLEKMDSRNPLLEADSFSNRKTICLR